MRIIDKLLKFVLIFWFFFAIIFAFLDLQISILFVNTQSNWAIFVEKFGEIPGYILIILAILIFIKNQKPGNNLYKIVLYTIFLIVLVYLLYSVEIRVFESYRVFSDFNSIFLIINGFLAIFLIYIFNKIDVECWKQYRIFSQITLILAIANPFLFVQIFKILWGRVRFRDLNFDYSNFTPWYIPQGITGHKSFPSGHAAMGWMLLPLSILQNNQKKNWKVRAIIFSFVFGWGIFVAFGRIVIGAHYASDVLFSTAMSFLIYLLSFRKYYTKNEENY